MAKIACCYNCVFAFLDPEHTLECYHRGILNWPACANHPDSYGRMRRTPERGICPNYRPKLPTPQGKSVKTIPLGDGYCAYVDAADYEWLSQWTWHLQNGYAVRRANKKLILMHREIMQPPPGMVVDHKNRNKLDNTRDSLLVCTQQENCYNRKKRNGSLSRFRGVSYSKSMRKWVARITFRGRRLHLGGFVEEVEAARAYDRAAVELFGEFAVLNFPEEWPPERRAEVYVQRDAEKEPVGATHASPVRGRSKATKAGKRKTKRPGEGKSTKARARTLAPKPRATSDERRATQQRTAKGKSKESRAETPGRKAEERKTQNARRKTKSEQATKAKAKEGRRTRPA